MNPLRTGLPLVAILRGLPPADAAAVGLALVASGWHLIEVPLNSPHPLESIAHLRAACPTACVGAGTVLRASDVDAVHAAGGQLIVCPHFAPEVVERALRLGLWVLPGVMTPSEAFAALALGAHGLKLFPGEVVRPEGLKAMRAVLPPAAMLFPVGGVNAASAAACRRAGANGLGVGSALYTPGLAAAEVGERARAMAQAWST